MVWWLFLLAARRPGVTLETCRARWAVGCDHAAACSSSGCTLNPALASPGSAVHSSPPVLPTRRRLDRCIIYRTLPNSCLVRGPSARCFSAGRGLGSVANLIVWDSRPARLVQCEQEQFKAGHSAGRSVSVMLAADRFPELWRQPLARRLDVAWRLVAEACVNLPLPG